MKVESASLYYAIIGQMIDSHRRNVVDNFLFQPELPGLKPAAAIRTSDTSL